MRILSGRVVGMAGLAAGLVAMTAADASAGWPRRARGRVVTVAPTTLSVAGAPVAVPSPTASVAAQRKATGLAPSPMLGTFYPDRYINIRGDFTTGAGYNPFGGTPMASADLYGPLSAFREVAAPVATYQRGYDGSFRPDLGVGFSTPNFPPTSPSGLVYPTRANAVGAPRRVGTPPQWDRGMNWIDMN